MITAAICLLCSTCFHLFYPMSSSTNISIKELTPLQTDSIMQASICLSQAAHSLPFIMECTVTYQSLFFIYLSPFSSLLAVLSSVFSSGFINQDTKNIKECFSVVLDSALPFLSLTYLSINSSTITTEILFSSQLLCRITCCSELHI
jgi:hypothetical protein